MTVEVVNTNVPFELKLCCNEIVENAATNDNAPKGTLKGSFALNVSICEYVTPDDLYDQLMGKKAGDVIIPRISLRSAKKMAKEYLANQSKSMIGIDDSDDEGDSSNKDHPSSLTFSLIDPSSRKALQTPVRGRQCKHLQCFDLKNFLHANSNLGGGRWRCLVSFLDYVEVIHAIRVD